MKYIKRMLPFVLVIALLLNGCPYVAKCLGKDLVLVILLTPFLCFAIGVAYSYLFDISKALPFIAMVLFLPAIFLFYTRTAAVYPIFFGLSVFIGEIAGKLLKREPDT